MNCVAKKIFVLVLLLSLSITNAVAQRKTVDSLLRLLPVAKDDTSVLIIMDGLIEAYKNVNLDSGVYYAQQQVLISQRMNTTYYQAYALSSYGSALFFAGNYPDAVAALLKALQKFESIADTFGIAQCYLNLGFVYRNSDEYRKAIDYFNKYKLVADHYNNDDMRLRFFAEAGRAYEQLNVLDTALLYQQQAYDAALRLKLNFGTGGVLCNLGSVHSKLGNKSVALDLFRQAVVQSLQHDDFRTLARCYNEMAKHFYKNKESDSALYYSKAALFINTQHSFTVQTLDAAILLTNIFKEQNRYDSAFKYQQIMLAAKDSLFSREKINRMENQVFNDQIRRQEIADQQRQQQNRIKVYSLLAALVVFLLVTAILVRNNRQKQRAKIKIEQAYKELKATQAQLIQAEKMASLGELTAGIAHEIQNPLNFVNNFSEVNKELIGELKEELQTGNKDEAIAIADDLEQNLEKITHHGKRADAIVKGMLLHSRASTGKKEAIDINALADEYLRLSYQDLRAKDKAFNATMQTNFDESIGKIDVVPQDIGRVLLNLFNNAFYAVTEKKKQAGDSYEPVVSVTTKKENDKVIISVRDNGVGIPQKAIDKIFQPFFTTKPTGQGTGLGLSLSYDIIKAHGGEIKVDTKEGEGAEFIIQLPAT